MALAEIQKETQEQEANQAAGGRFFNAQEAYVDLSDLGQLSAQVIGFAGLIRRRSGQRGEVFKDAFAESIDELKARLHVREGILRVQTERLPIAPKPKLAALASDYGSRDGAYLVPAEAVTAASVLPFMNVTSDYRPVVDLRLRTSADKPVTVFGGAGETRAEPSAGSWFRFDLGSTALSHLVNF